jgi:DNA-binding winged helix-turn-helix (wHTH) protein/Tfp pilus assembly protein PilF
VEGLIVGSEGFAFKDHYVDSAARLLWRNSERIPLTPHAFDTLFCLVKAGGRLVTKEELMEAVWPDTHVEQGNLTQNISALRRALGDSKFIETVPTRGYRFAVPVEEIPVRDSEARGAEVISKPSTRNIDEPVTKAPIRSRYVAGSAVLLIAVASGYLISQRAHSTVSVRRKQNIKSELDYVRGREEWSQRTLSDLNEAMDKFQAAIDRDPGYALAYSGLADSLVLLGSYNIYAPKDIFPRAKAAARDALKLDSQLAEAHASLAAIQGGYDWDWKGAEIEFRKAIQLKPDYATAHQWYAEQLSAQGRHAEAIREARIAVELQPHSPTSISLLGLTYYFARQDDKALSQYRLALEFNPNFLLTFFFNGYLYEQQGKYRDAVAAFQKGVELAQGAGLAHLGHALAVSGDRDEAHHILERLHSRSAKAYVSPLDIAMVYLGLGEREAAFTWMERAYEDHSQWLEQLKVDPRYDPLRSDPRFHSLLKRVHLE